jgi:hypothetical protein
MIDSLPIALTPAGSDLRDFPYMPLDVARFRDSGFAARTNGDEFQAGVLLICAAWHQLPAGSLPDDDAELSALAGFGRVISAWKKVRAGALRGWIKCADGRLYHPVVAEKANHAWEEKLLHRWKNECDRLRKENAARAKKGLPILTLPSRPDAAPKARRLAGRLAEAGSEQLDGATPSVGIPPEPSPQAYGIPTEDVTSSDGIPIALAKASTGPPQEVAASTSDFQRKSLLKREGEGEGEGEGEEKESERKSSSSGTKPAARDRKRDDDDLRRKLKEAAKGRIAPGCANVGPIRKLLEEGIPLDAVLACFSNNVARLRRPLQTFGADFIAIEARHNAEAMAAAVAQGNLASTAIKRAFVPADAAHWPLVEARYCRERGKKPTRNATGPDGDKSRPGWWFLASWPECTPATADRREAA